MSKTTEEMLLETYKSIVIPLEDICESHLGMSWAHARNQAALNKLPFPTVRLNPSQRGRVVVYVKDLAKFIDNAIQNATASWEKSQV